MNYLKAKVGWNLLDGVSLKILVYRASRMEVLQKIFTKIFLEIVHGSMDITRYQGMFPGKFLNTFRAAFMQNIYQEQHLSLTLDIRA